MKERPIEDALRAELARNAELIKRLYALVEALDGAHRQTEMCIRKAAIGLKVTQEDNAKYEEYLSQRDTARAALDEMREGGKV